MGPDGSGPPTVRAIGFAGMPRSWGSGSTSSSSVRFRGRRSRVTVGLASVTVSPIPTTALYLASSPTKAVESLALGVPVVGTPIPDQAESIAASGGGSIAPFVEEPFAAAVAALLADPSAARQMGAEGPKARAVPPVVRAAGRVGGGPLPGPGAPGRTGSPPGAGLTGRGGGSTLRPLDRESSGPS